ncbi:MAG: SigE family RNA polymerase sigma factor [Dermatophilaceae bacterium]|jgi:RNA polymerase sigma-70 factor (sigma-E family)|nr:SigE family RNA polymerase sigma factor [Dermatophilaceae bacterium]
MRGSVQRERDASFTAFMRGAQPSLLRTAYFLCGDADLARELVQDALVRTYLAWPKVRQETALAYARRILVNGRADHGRRMRREVPSPVLREVLVEADTSHVEREQLVELLAQLPEQQRKVIVLRYCADLSERQTADLVGLSVGGVKSAASRGLAALRQLAISSEGKVHEH